MSDYNKCAKCGDYDWLARHRCKPEWLAADCDDGPWDPADASTVRGVDAEEAAEAFAESRDDEGNVIRAGEIDVFVAPADALADVGRWRVSAEARVHYSAERVDDAGDGRGSEP